MEPHEVTALSRTGIYDQLNETENEFRLLVIHPGRDTDELSCHLEVASLDTGCKPQYETISYCWGDATICKAITVNGYETQVPASSAAALRAVRLVDRPRTVWIDAICINQDNVREKSSQVANMDVVYVNGECNLICLGEDVDQTAAERFEALVVLADEVRSAAPPETSDAEREEWTLCGYLPRAWELMNIMSASDKGHLCQVLVQPWFKRVWTMQEFALAQRNVCLWGRAMMDLHDLVAVCRVYVYTTYHNDISNLNLEIGGRAATLHSFYRRRHEVLQTKAPLGFNLSYLHDTVTSRLAGNPKDYVFGVVGLLKFWKRWDSIPQLLQPDYTKSTSDVFRDATRALLESGDDSILEHVFFSSEAELLARRPSWTVRWDSKASHALSLPPGSMASAAKDEESRTCTSRLELGGPTTDLNLLRVKGFFLKEITWLGPSLKHALDRMCSGSFAEMDELVDGLIVHAKHRPHNFFQLPSPDELAMAVLTSGRWMYGPWYFKDLRDAAAALKDLKVYAARYGKLPPDDQAHPNRTPAWKLCTFLRPYSRCFGLADGHVGIGPHLTRIGDRIFVMRNGRFPHMTRPCEDHVRLLGVVYIHEPAYNPEVQEDVRHEWVNIV